MRLGVLQRTTSSTTEPRLTLVKSTQMMLMTLLNLSQAITLLFVTSSKLFNSAKTKDKMLLLMVKVKMVGLTTASLFSLYSAVEMKKGVHSLQFSHGLMHKTLLHRMSHALRLENQLTQAVLVLMVTLTMQKMQRLHQIKFLAQNLQQVMSPARSMTSMTLKKWAEPLFLVDQMLLTTKFVLTRRH